MIQYFDTHAHLDCEAFDFDREELIFALIQNNIRRVLNPGCDVASSKAALSLAEDYPIIYAAVGIHPEFAAEADSAQLAEIAELAESKHCVAIGEVGLDYHYEPETKELQKRLLLAQAELARDMDLPMLFHIRDAYGDFAELLRQNRGLFRRGVMHCYTGSADYAKELLSFAKGNGSELFFAFGGAVTFKNARHCAEAAAVIPEELLLLETDCPYMAPVPYRGKRNEPAYVAYTAARLAGLRNTTQEHIAELTLKNAARLIGRNTEI